MKLEKGVSRELLYKLQEHFGDEDKIKLRKTEAGNLILRQGDTTTITNPRKVRRGGLCKCTT